MNEVTKELLEALQKTVEALERENPLGWAGALKNARAAIFKAEAILAAPQPADDNWIPWTGGDCPVGSEVIVAVRDKKGYTDNYGKARLYDWRHTGNGLDIVAYKVVKLSEEI